MAFNSFRGNSGPVAPPKNPIYFGPSDQSQSQSQSPPRLTQRIPSKFSTSASPPKSRARSINSPSPSPPRPSPPQPPPPPPTTTTTRSKPKPRSRSRSPTPPQCDDERQREIEAKARRLARFKTELDYPVRPSSPPLERQQQQQQPPQQQQTLLPKKDVDETMDYEDADPILGACPDMCPESERGERERKGDLDKFERLHGDRNLTDKSLTVKKYNRTAEREASLIRPLPVLQMTIDHLLNLIDRSYDDDFLSIYNFLWDRMRAIRMDLRIQHIFNKESIIMHEQMIRFHIVAMHELCEYTKGEGFSEGFDAHLNLEQMNKTSVELFQMYDDHRKRGSPVPTEQEFRGYYALLKLDKHPGYKVEPAELSLDLAKMTTEMRNTNEVLFAREVARASRSGSYIAFFRLARKATYLQACLMHAHFAKLRTQALASLHSGLQKNQGIPAAQVVKWLAMEGEDIEGLLEYHGFSLKQFEDLYMVKEGPFLNNDVDFATKRSQLVHQKRSAKVASDVIFSGQVPIMDGTSDTIKALDAEVDNLLNSTKGAGGPAFNSIVPPEEEMPDYEEDALLSNEKKVKDWEMQGEFGSCQTKKVEEADVMEIGSPIPKLGGELPIRISGQGKHTISWSKSLQEQHAKKKRRNISELDVENKRRLLPLKIHFGAVVESEEPARPLVHDINEMHGTETVKDWTVVVATPQEEKEKLAMWKAEADCAKLKLLVRRWKRRASEIAETRLMRQFKANAALNSLFVGPPIRSYKGIASREEFLGGIPSCVELNIDQIVRERQNRHMRMWSKLDVPEVIGPILSQINSQAKCLCWKLVLCSRTNDKSCTHSSLVVGQWLRAKLMGNDKTDREELSLSITDVDKTEHSGSHSLFCLTILRDVAFNADRLENQEASIGASGLLFLLVDKVRWDLERSRLQSLVSSVELGSCLPLLILSFGNAEESTIENQLELCKLDRMRVSNWSVILVNETNNDTNRFLSDDSLRKGLLWLAAHAPPLPNVYPSDMRNLVLESLKPYLNILLNAKPSEVTPSYCIHAFNEALNEAESHIVLAAENSLPGWPPPEIKYFDTMMGGGFLDSYFPRSGWNLACNIQAYVHALKLCRLPELSSFNMDPIFCRSHSQELSSFNLLSENNNLGDIQEQKISLQKCLYQYLCQIGFAKGGVLMTLKEADLMVQKHTSCECIDSRQVIVPHWTTIFRRIYNWQLMLLASEPAPIVYVTHPRKIGLLVNELKQHLLSSVRQVLMSSANAYQVAPSLNEMLESTCSIISSGLRLEPNVQTARDQLKQHTKDKNPEYMVQTGFIDVSKNSYGQNMFVPIQKLVEDNFVPTEHIAEEVTEFCEKVNDEVHHNIEFGQTDGEIQLSQVMTKFCEKVNEQKQRIALLMEGENITDGPGKVNPAGGPCTAEREFSAYEEIRRPHRCGSESLAPKAIDFRMTVSTPTWATDNAMDKLNNLLEKCSAVQSSIDKKLAGYFGEN